MNILLSIVLLILCGTLLVADSQNIQYEENISGLVVNGTDAKDGEFPFIISLQKFPSVTHSCGGSIIHPQWVITAAHCVIGNTNPETYVLKYGNADLDAAQENVAFVTKVIPHENYSPSNQYENDIALLQLFQPLTFDDYTNQVNLPKQGQNTPGGSTATLIGWGRNASEGIVQLRLQKVDLRVFSDEECQSIHYAPVHSTNICAGVDEGGQGQCSGDSGGPLIKDNELIGLVSWSVKPCAVYPYPGVYTEVSAYIEWIRENTGLDF